MATKETPDLFKDPKKSMQNLGDNLSQDIINRAAQYASQFGVTKTSPHYLQVTVKRMNKKGVIDLKPYFESSASAKHGKNGWYLIVPIRRKVKGMSSGMYAQASAIDIPQGNISGTNWVDLLYENRSSTASISAANYTPKSNNLSRVRNGKKSTYVAFRTVSAKSSPSSWILNRDRINDENFSRTMLKNMDRVFRQMVAKVGR